MARWDDENFATELPPGDIMCTTCKFKLKPVTVGDYVQDRSGYAMCGKFKLKPQDVLWGKNPCKEYEREEG